MKIAMCVHCTDFVTPFRNWAVNRAWRWCVCGHTAVRWRDGLRGLLEVTSLHGHDGVRVIGMNNSFLQLAVKDPVERDGLTFPEWRTLHELSTTRVEPGYLFHADKRACWALVVRVGESGDVTFVPYGEATTETSPASSTG